MTSWVSKIEVAASVTTGRVRRSSFEVLNRLWSDNSQLLVLRSNHSTLRKEHLINRSATESEAALIPQPTCNLAEKMSADIIGSVINCGSGCESAYNSRAVETGRHRGQCEVDSLLISPSPGNNGRGGRGKAVVIVPMTRSDGNRGDCDDRGDSKLWKSHGNHSMGLVLSALYAKLLVVMGIAFPLSEVMSTYIPSAYYDGFYLYLYFGSILFMIWVFGYILRERARISARVLVKGMNSLRLRKAEAIEHPPLPPPTTNNHNLLMTSNNQFPNDNLESPVVPPSVGKSFFSDVEDDYSDGSTGTPPTLPDTPTSLFMEEGNMTKINVSRRQKGTHFGSFYLRMGCVAFGIGSMIYSGLEFGQYFELKSDSKCHNYMMALTPSVRMIFTFMQMYFIFLSSRMAVFKESLSSQFGLMHMIGTNLSVWFNVLVQETKHEILSFYDPDNKTISFKSVRAHQKFSGLTLSPPSSKIHGDEGGDDMLFDLASNLTSASDVASQMFAGYGTLPGSEEAHSHHRVIRGLRGPYSIHECGRTNIIGSIVQDAAPFLFPCTIEYSLICAAICYVMWKSMAKRKTEQIVHKHSFRRALTKTYDTFKVPHHPMSKSPHHYTVDCANSHKGLFVGIFVLVLTIMSLIINFVLVKHPDYRVMANLEAHITEIALYTMATCAVIIGMCQVRALRYSRGRNLELDNILLIVAQTGSLIFNIFAIISGQFILKKGENLVLATALLKVIQLLLQTLFILDASKRVATTMDQVKKKPGREVITFLLITNLAMWLINALEKSRGESHPAQLQFYGVWAWTIITHISMPLAIFYRFHSTVCLCEIWKRAYKMKHVVE